MSALGGSPPDNIPRRDFLILPLLSLFTIAFLTLSSEFLARFCFPEDKIADPCRVDDAIIGFKYRANCTSRVKSAEGPWVVNHYNDCGYRSKDSCGPKPPGTFRISLIGSSVAQGLYVPYNETWPARAEQDLTRMCGRPVEVQNLGREMCHPDCEFYRVDEALALQPDLAVITITSYDLEHLVSLNKSEDADWVPPKPAPVTAPDELGLLKRAQTVVTGSRAVTVAEHYLFEDPSTYTRLYLNYGDKADFLRQPFTPAWQSRLQDFDLLLGEMAAKFRAAHVPVVLIEIPSLAQVSLLSLQGLPANVDPFAFDRRLEQISAKYRIQFVSVLYDFQRTPGSNRFFYMVDGHMNGDGEALVEDSFVHQLLSGQHAALAGCRVPPQLQAFRKNS